MDAEGNLQAVLITYLNEDEVMADRKTTEICKVSLDGTVTSSLDISGVLQKLKDQYIQCVITDNEGNIYLSFKQLLLVLDKNGKELTKVESDSMITNLFAAKDGTVFLTYLNPDGLKIYPVDLEKKSLGDLEENLMISQTINYNFIKGTDSDLLFSVDNKLYSYNLGDKKPTEILSWIDCGINSETLRYFAALEDGRILAINSFQEEDYISMDLIYLTKMEGSEIPEKTLLTYGTLSLDPEIKKQIVKFNKINNDYKIEVKEYMTDDLEIALTQLNTDIVSGKCPDILDCTSGKLPTAKYIDKGILEDLYPFIDNDPELRREDYLENVLNAYGKDGKLYAITPRFFIITMTGKVSDVGDKRNITLDEMIEIVNAMPEGMDLYQYNSKSTVLMDIIMSDLDQFVDWSTGECRFSGEEFIKVLEFADKFDLEYTYGDQMSDAARRISEGTLLMHITTLSSVQAYQVTESMFDGPIAFVGFPTNKDNGSVLSSTGSVTAMSAKSEHKEGAWQFIRMGITEEAQETPSKSRKWGFPIMKSALEARFIEDMTEEYYISSDGTKVKQPKFTKEENDGSKVDFYAATEEQITIVRNLIMSVDTIISIDENIYNIILSETEAYFQGRKKAQEVADIIQNRVQIYVNEGN